MRLYHHLSVFLLTCFLLFSGISGTALHAKRMLSGEELQLLTEMLEQSVLKPEHTGFYRDWDHSTQAKSAWHMDVLQGGLDAMPLLDEMRSLMAEEDLDRMLSCFSQIAWEEEISHRHAEPLEFKNPKALFRYVENSYHRLEIELNSAFARLSPAETDSLSSFILLLMAENESEDIHRKFLSDQGLPYLEDADLESFIPLLMKVDWSGYVAALSGMRRLQQQIAEYRPENKRITIYKSRFGLMIVGSMDDDLYSEASLKELKDHPVCLMIEPGGNDVYSFPFATGKNNPFFIHIDHAGDDLYRSMAPSFFGFRGIGLSMDLAGDDIYQLGDFSFAAVLGVQMHLDADGDDSYRGGNFSQGAGLAGISILMDRSGNDSYSAHAMSQGFGSTLGVGVLADYAGADLYYLGGKYLHAPLMPDDYRTMGQGMGFGLRPHLAGGLGFLYDKSGNDKYMGGVYAQGVGYWYATGLLIDEGGNDVYNAIYYPQGSGIHMASGILYDHEGDDAYYSRHGPGQGAGHDWSFGLFIDAAGNDAYSIEGGGGLGLTNSLGIFVDKSGNDRYERKHEQNYGYANFSRSTGGIGLFLDAGGEDRYALDEIGNDQSWQRGSYGMGRDFEFYISEEQETVSVVKQDPLISEDAEISEVFAAAAEWEVGSAVERVRSARELMKSRTSEASQYILENKLDTVSGLEYRALEAFNRDNAEFSDLLLGFVEDPDSLKAKNAISLLAGEKDLRLLPYLESFLQQGRYLASCISVLGFLDDPAGLSLLMHHRNQDDERLRFLVVRALSMHESAAAKKALESFEDDDSFLIQALIRKLEKDKP